MLEQGTLTLGRGAENDWVLPDPDRMVSKLHCRVDSSDAGFVITDQSTNGVFVNDSPQPIGRGRSRVLADGDIVSLGQIRIAVAITAPASHEAPNSFDAEFQSELPSPARPGPNAGFPFSGVPQFPGSPIAPGADEPWLEAIPGGEFGPDRHVKAQGWEIPLDPADYAASGVRAASHPLDAAPMEFSHGSEHSPATATVMKLPAAQSVLPTDWNDADPLAGATFAPSPIEALEQARPGQPASPDYNSIEIPGEDLLASQQAEPVYIPTQAPEPVAAIVPGQSSTARSLPDAVEAGLVPTPTAAAGMPAAGAATAAEGPPGISLLDAFLEGAGLTRDAVAGMSEADVGRDLGQMVRAAIEGVRDILATRAMVKSELRVPQTIIQADNNSAMKFAPDVRRCLAAMVGHPPQGFLLGSAAMAGAMDDIKRHELALISALNSVFATLAENLDPDAIDAKVRADGGIGNVLPFAREARCWAIYLEQYRAFQTTDADNTAGSLLAPLASAYARQLRRADPPAAAPSAPKPPQENR